VTPAFSGLTTPASPCPTARRELLFLVASIPERSRYDTRGVAGRCGRVPDVHLTVAGDGLSPVYERMQRQRAEGYFVDGERNRLCLFQATSMSAYTKPRLGAVPEP